MREAGGKNVRIARGEKKACIGANGELNWREKGTKRKRRRKEDE